MYFDIQPKSKKEDFFNYNNEYEKLKDAIKRRDKLIAVVGVRRVGKTTLLNILFNETADLKLWLDGRIIEDPKKEIYSAIYDVAKSGKPKIFGKIESLNLSAFGIGLDIKVQSDRFADIENKIKNSGKITVFIDEAQRMDPSSLADILSYSYDRFPNITFIISGSEVGLLERVLGEANSNHPLYGRSIIRIQMERLDKNRAFEFFTKGFQQTKTDVTKDEMSSAISELDGLIGWLTLFGYERGVLKNSNALKQTVEKAAGIAASELLSFFKTVKNRKLYLSIIRNADGTSWNELKLKVAKDLNLKSLNPNSLNFTINKLIAYSFIEKKDDKYWISDPLLLKASFLVS